LHYEIVGKKSNRGMRSGVVSWMIWVLVMLFHEYMFMNAVWNKFCYETPENEI
jgi:hypothetical protein